VVLLFTKRLDSLAAGGSLYLGRVMWRVRRPRNDSKYERPATPNQESVFLTTNRRATPASEPGDVPFAGLRSKSGAL